jgi:hypothetical protein
LLVVVVGVIVTEGPVPPEIGAAVFPVEPRYHWYESGAVPVAITDSVALEPGAIVTDDVRFVIAGGVHVGAGVPGEHTLPG